MEIMGVKFFSENRRSKKLVEKELFSSANQELAACLIATLMLQ